jgi:hypothetical protein
MHYGDSLLTTSYILDCLASFWRSAVAGLIVLIGLGGQPIFAAQLQDAFMSESSLVNGRAPTATNTKGTSRAAFETRFGPFTPTLGGIPTIVESTAICWPRVSRNNSAACLSPSFAAGGYRGIYNVTPLFISAESKFDSDPETYSAFQPAPVSIYFKSSAKRCASASGAYCNFTIVPAQGLMANLKSDSDWTIPMRGLTLDRANILGRSIFCSATSSQVRLYILDCCASLTGLIHEGSFLRPASVA